MKDTMRFVSHADDARVMHRKCDTAATKGVGRQKYGLLIQKYARGAHVLRMKDGARIHSVSDGDSDSDDDKDLEMAAHKHKAPVQTLSSGRQILSFVVGVVFLIFALWLAVDAAMD